MRKFIARYLDPIDAVVELIYGVLIIMTFTMAVGAFDVRWVPDQLVEQHTQNLLWAALGCAIAWGMIDAVVYIMTCVAERNTAAKVLRDVQAAPTDEAARDVVAEAMDDSLIPIADQKDREEIYAHVTSTLQEVHTEPDWIKGEDIKGGIGIFLVALVATLPVAIPLLFGNNPSVTMRVANFLSLVILFLAGYWWARQTGTKPVRTGLVVAALGAIVVAIAIPLGG